MTSYGEKFLTSSGELVYLVKGKDAQRTVWHYILVNKLKLPLFLKKLETDYIELSDYGVLLYSGWGDEPPVDIVEKIEATYS